MAGDGVPRQLSVTYPTNSDEINLGTKAYDNSGFSPRLYADGYSFYAYTVNNSGALQRYTLTKNNRGVIRFAHRVTIGNGYGSLTSLQAGSLFGKGRKEKEYLYATTSSRRPQADRGPDEAADPREGADPEGQRVRRRDRAGLVDVQQRRGPTRCSSASTRSRTPPPGPR